MLKKLGVVAAVSSAVVAAAGYAVVAHAGGGDQNYGRTFTLVESGTGMYVDERTQAPPDFSKPIPPGDSVVFKADVLREGVKVGDARGDCTSAFDNEFICSVAFSITRHGTLELQVLFDLADPQGDYVVTGGTGDFAGKHGWAHFTTLSNGDEVHTFHLSGD